MSTQSFDDFILMNQLENELDLLFEIECPEPKNPIMTNKDKILNEFKKYLDFWHSKKSVTNMLMNPAKNKEIFYKNNYCDFKIVVVMKEIRRIGLEKEFRDKFIEN